MKLFLTSISHIHVTDSCTYSTLLYASLILPLINGLLIMKYVYPFDILIIVCAEFVVWKV